MKPIMILFAMAVTITIYVSSDTTMLGFICGDYTVGIYSVSTKVYTIIKILLSSILVVSIPRLSSMLGHKDTKGFNLVATRIYKSLISIVVPAITGIIILRVQIVLLISDSSYLAAESSLALLSIALFFSLGAWFWGQCVLVPLRLEGVILKATVVSALVNIGLNFFLIPVWKENGAAFTTILAEAIAFFWLMFEGKKYSEIYDIGKTLFKVFIGSIAIVLCSVALQPLKQYLLLYTTSTISISAIVYFLVEIILKNESITNVFSIFMKRRIN